ncbi:hypothetical protein HOR11_gp087 [Lactobacillus phage SA-C12]|uniref:Uncharacterized protein n=1 Tax=Lactobacillus phage SA-C12 TaxID=1755697 RepID=A0A1I9KKD1_9CAUD|nr:hypothetical protein HOR11_gp087 [Lactobacillus phage SA-C12]ALY06908.1 hypothetical protein SAC12_087 [Lactobacillus phage SA-C12]
MGMCWHGFREIEVMSVESSSKKLQKLLIIKMNAKPTKYRQAEDGVERDKVRAACAKLDTGRYGFCYFL